jgi:hypothetical protein
VLAFSFMSLLLEASRVIELRLQMIAAGAATTDEFSLMIFEKMEAFAHAGQIMAGGGAPDLVVANYRRIVAANVVRLSSKR